MPREDGFGHLHSRAEVVFALNLDSVQRSQDLVDRVVPRRGRDKNLRAVRPWYKEPQKSRAAVRAEKLQRMSQAPSARAQEQDLREAIVMTPTALCGFEVLVLQMRFTASACESIRVGT